LGELSTTNVLVPQENLPAAVAELSRSAAGADPDSAPGSEGSTVDQSPYAAAGAVAGVAAAALFEELLPAAGGSITGGVLASARLIQQVSHCTEQSGALAYGRAAECLPVLHRQQPAAAHSVQQLSLNCWDHPAAFVGKTLRRCCAARQVLAAVPEPVRRMSAAVESLQVCCLPLSCPCSDPALSVMLYCYCRICQQHALQH